MTLGSSCRSLLQGRRDCFVGALGFKVTWCASAGVSGLLAILAGVWTRVDTPPCLALGGLGPSLAPRALVPLASLPPCGGRAVVVGPPQGPAARSSHAQVCGGDQSGLPASPVWSAAHLHSFIALDPWASWAGQGKAQKSAHQATLLAGLAGWITHCEVNIVFCIYHTFVSA